MPASLVVPAYVTAGLLLALANGVASPTMQGVIYHLVGVAAPLAILLGVSVYRPGRGLHWYLIAGGAGLTAVGDFLWDAYGWFGVAVPFPSVADVVYLLGYAFLVAGLLVINRRTQAARGRDLLDAAILASAALLVLYVFLIGPTIDSGDTVLARATAAAYPIMDSLLLVVLVPIALARARNVSLALLLGFAALTCVTDLIYGLQMLHGTYVSGGWLDSGWVLASALLGASALHPSMRESATPLPRREWDD